MDIVKTHQLIGAVSVAVGALFLYLAYHAANSPLEKLSDAITGRYSAETVWYFAIGVVALVGGAFFAINGARK